MFGSSLAHQWSSKLFHILIPSWSTAIYKSYISFSRFFCALQICFLAVFASRHILGKVSISTVQFSGYKLDNLQILSGVTWLHIVSGIHLGSGIRCLSGPHQRCQQSENWTQNFIFFGKLLHLIQIKLHSLLFTIGYHYIQGLPLFLFFIR